MGKGKRGNSFVIGRDDTQRRSEIMKGTLFTRREHAGEQDWEEIEFSSFEEAVRIARTADGPGCGCCKPAVRAKLPNGRILKADPNGYWIACRHGRWACPECGDPVESARQDQEEYDGAYGPIVPGSNYVLVPE